VAYIAQLNAAKVFPTPIVTTIEPGKEFYPAEAYRQDYLALHPYQPYICHQRSAEDPSVKESVS
jgi:peptide-methionine (S)-S-oxide reductase